MKTTKLNSTGQILKIGQTQLSYGKNYKVRKKEKKNRRLELLFKVV